MKNATVSVSTDKYFFTNREMPRGEGVWFFLVGNQERHFMGTYSFAKRMAMKVAREQSIYSIQVQP